MLSSSDWIIRTLSTNFSQLNPDDRSGILGVIAEKVISLLSWIPGIQTLFIWKDGQHETGFRMYDQQHLVLLVLITLQKQKLNGIQNVSPGSKSQTFTNTYLWESNFILYFPLQALPRGSIGVQTNFFFCKNDIYLAVKISC